MLNNQKKIFVTFETCDKLHALESIQNRVCIIN